MLGYSLVPFVILALVGLFASLTTLAGVLFSGLVAMWSCLIATRLIVNKLDVADQKFLIAYPIGLFYCVFVILTIF